MPQKRRQRRPEEGQNSESPPAPDNGPSQPSSAHEPGEHSKGPGSQPAVADKRFDVFIIDSGWNTPISTALLRYLDQMRVYLEGDDLFIIDQTQSIALLKSNPHLIGHDPMILFLDRRRKDAGHERYGLRLNLGLLRKPEQALARLQSALRLVAENRASIDIYHAVQKELWHAGIDGAFRVVGEAALELV
jgi:hypothetical protein